jgi:mono/diheme cytochrome c family protein
MTRVKCLWVFAELRCALLLAALVLPLSTLQAAESGAEGPAAVEVNACGPTAENLRGSAENGKLLHQQHCAACHGLTGAADVLVMHMDETPEDQSDPEYMSKLPDGFLYLAICRGGEGIGKSIIMSPWGDFFTDGEIRDLIAWIRTFSNT